MENYQKKDRRKKTLILSAASILLLGGLVSGTFAIYQSQVNVAKGNVNTKEFYFLEGGNDTFNLDWSLAPGESQTTQIAVKNFDGAKVSQVDMDVYFNVNLEGELADMVDAEGNKLLTYTLVTSGDAFKANVPETITADFTVSLSDKATLEVMGKTASFSITAFASQHV